MNKKHTLALFAFTLLFVVSFVFSFGVGKYPVSPGELLHVLWGTLTGATPDWSSEIELIIFKIRMPRILAGALVGAGLSAAGVAYQGVFRNPMVSPDLLGASSGAGFGAALALFLGAGYSAVTLNSFIFGIFAVTIAYLVSVKAKGNQTLSIVLAGIMVSSLFSSATSFIKLVADPNNTLPAITYWLMGSISNMNMTKFWFAFFPVVAGLLILFLFRWKINLLTMGEEEAHSMGVNTKQVRTFTILAATLITAACVSISGVIGWIGLVIPHFARILVGYDYRVLLPSSILLGASFLMSVDDISRSLATIEIPIGILTSFVGAPFFLYLILRKGKNA